jgi:hypothetical protein
MDLHEALAEHKELYIFELEGDRVLFRPLNWEDYKNFSHLMMAYPLLQSDLEDSIWQVAVIEHNFPTGVELIEAGIVQTVAQLILYYSGCNFRSRSAIGRLNTSLTQAREEKDSVEGQIKLAICEAFPSYKPEELDQLTWSQLVERLAFSEHLLKKDFEFNIKDKDKIEDDSNKVFDMLDEHSINKGPGILAPEVTETEMPRDQKSWSRQAQTKMSR